MVLDFYDHAVDQVPKDLDGVLMAGLKVHLCKVITKDYVDKIPESRWPSLLNRFRSQLPPPANGDQPSSPLTTISDGSQKSDDEVPVIFDQPRQLRDQIERLPTAEEDVRTLYF
jgi:hypothetical protein